jgi:tetratricopeptide (TPR) repeat protein
VLGLARFAVGRAQFLTGDLTAAEQELQLSVAAREVAADSTAAAESHIQLAVIQSALGQATAAELSIRAALDQVGRAATTTTSAANPQPRVTHWRPRWLLASAALAQGRLRMDRGDRAPARRHFTSALQTADFIAAREMALEARIELADLHATFASSAAEPESVGTAIEDLRSALDAALALELRPLACRARVVLATLLCARRAAEPATSTQLRDAAVLARDALVQARALGLKLHAAAAQRVLAIALAQLGHWPQAAREFDSAAADLEHSGATVELIRTLIAYAQAERAQGSPPHNADVHARLIRAQQLAESIGLAPERQLARRLLSAASA